MGNYLEVLFPIKTDALQTFLVFEEEAGLQASADDNDQPLITTTTLL
jgi:hypothetical protein